MELLAALGLTGVILAIPSVPVAPMGTADSITHRTETTATVLHRTEAAATSVAHRTEATAPTIAHRTEATAPTARRAEGPAEALARRIEQRHQRVGDLTARFVQTYRSGILSQEVVERGVVSLKRPGRMLWEYRDPEKKTFVSDGKTFYFYVPADRQVIVREQAGQRGIPALLLSGREDLLAEFDASLEPPPAQGVQRLRLTPRKADPEVERIFLDVDQGDRIRAVRVRDAQGNESRFEFDRIRENVGLPDRLFRFQVPPGVEVVAG